jgi:PAXIP1-associated protein 1
MTTSEPCATDEDDWFVECSDEENHKFTPDDMRDMYEKLARGDPIELEWKCPGRRPPTPEKQEEKTEVQPVTLETAPQPRLV